MGTIKIFSLIISLFIVTSISIDGFAKQKKVTNQNQKKRSTFVREKKENVAPAGWRNETDQLHVKVKDLEKENTALTFKNNNLAFQVESLKRQLLKFEENGSSNASTTFLTFLILLSVTVLFILLKREAQIETRVQEAQHKKTRAAIREVFTQLTTGSSGFLQSAISSVKEPLGGLEKEFAEEKYSNRRQTKARANASNDKKPNEPGLAKPKAS